MEIRRKLDILGPLGINHLVKTAAEPGNCISTGIGIEEVAKVDFLVGGHVTPSSAALMATRRAPREVQGEWISSLISGEKIKMPANAKNHRASDASAIKSTTVKEGDPYALVREKVAIYQTFNYHSAVVFANIDSSADFYVVTAFLLYMDLPGITLFPITYSGWKPQWLGGFAMEKVRIPQKYRLSKEGTGFHLAMSQFDFLQAGIGLTALVMSQSSPEEAMQYAQQRTVLRRPIASFQGISFKLVEDATMAQNNRLLCCRALSMNNQGLLHTKESAVAKWFCLRIATQVIRECVLAMGHFGYTADYPLAERLGNVGDLEMGDGTPGIMKTILVHWIIGKGSVCVKGLASKGQARES